MRSPLGFARQAIVSTRGLVDHPGNDGRRARAFARAVAWQAWQRLVRRPLPISFEGLRLWCFPHQESSSAVLYTGLPEWNEMRFVKDYLREGDSFVDVGANVGVYTLLAASRPGVRVTAFEPSSATFAILEHNISGNRLGDRVTTHRSAVGAAVGEVHLSVGHNSMNRVVDSGEGERVPLTTLDASCPSPTLIKIDVEGFELDVLRGGDASVRSNKPALLLEANDASGLRSWLTEAGYKIYAYEPDARTLRPLTGDAMNWIAVADPDEARSRGITVAG